MKDSTFADPAGLDDATSYKGGPRMSAYDIAIATRNALTVPTIAQWGATRTYEFTDPTGLHAHAHEPQQDAARRRLTPTRAPPASRPASRSRAGHTLSRPQPATGAR